MYDDLPKLMYEGKMVRPVRDNYGYNPAYGVVKSDQPGTLPRMNRNIINGPSEVSCSIHLRDYLMQQWWDTFYYYTIAEGSKRFLVELLVNGIIKTHVAQIVSQPSISTVGWKGDVSLKLAVVPTRNRCFDISLSLLLPCYGSKTKSMICQIEETAKLFNNAWERK